MPCTHPLSLHHTAFSTLPFAHAAFSPRAEGPQRDYASGMVSELSTSLGVPVTLPTIQHAPGFDKYLKVVIPCAECSYRV